jgi:hypothetical protein
MPASSGEAPTILMKSRRFIVTNAATKGHEERFDSVLLRDLRDLRG